jgi:O-antigen/teichoic acid export membrane protein
MRLAVRNVGTNYLAYGAAIVSGLILTPITISAITKEGYGAWVFIASLTTLLRVLDFGISPTVIRYTAFHRGSGAADDIHALASASFAVFLVLGLMSLLVGLVLAWFLPSMISLPADLEQPAQVACVIAVFTLATQAPLGLFGSLLKGAQRFDVLNAGTLVSIAVYFVLVVTVLTRHGTLPILATLALIATVVRLSYPLLYVRRELPGLRLSPRLVTGQSVRELLGFSGYTFFSHVAGKVLFSADVLVIGAVLGAKQVALYGVAARLFDLATSVAATGTDVMLPVQSELEGRGEQSRQRALTTTGIRAATCVAVLLALPMVVLPAWVLHAWLGSGFSASIAPLALLGATVPFTVITSVLGQFLIARGRPSLLAVSQIALAVANLALTILLLLETREIWTAAFATLVVQIAGALLLLPLLARREGMPYAAVVVSWGTPVAVGILAAVPTLVVARVLTDTDSLLVLAVVGAYWAAVFSALAWRLALTRGERTMVRGLARRGRATIPAAEV